MNSQKSTHNFFVSLLIQVLRSYFFSLENDIYGIILSLSNVSLVDVEVCIFLPEMITIWSNDGDNCMETRARVSRELSCLFIYFFFSIFSSSKSCMTLEMKRNCKLKTAPGTSAGNSRRWQHLLEDEVQEETA